MHFVGGAGGGVVDSFNYCAGVRKAGGETHHHRNAAGLGVVEGFAGHFIGLLLRRGLEHGHEGEGSVEAGVLLVLGTVHGRVVAGSDDQAAVGSGDCGTHERVCADVESHMLEANQRTLAGEGHSKRLFHCRFFVHRPSAVNAPLCRKRVTLNVFRYFCGWGAGVCVNPAEAGVQSA